ncbi:hypothetical protein EMCRGX_G016739 [Ephydatia muelleri]
MADEGVRGMEAVEKQWTNRFLSLRTNWAKMNRGKSRRSAASMVAFQSFQKAVFYEAAITASDLTSAEECRHQLIRQEKGPVNVVQIALVCLKVRLKRLTLKRFSPIFTLIPEISKEPCGRAMASPTGRDESAIIDLNFLTYAIVTVGAGERHVCSELQADRWNMNHEQEPSLKQKRTIMSADYIKAKLIFVRETLGDNQKRIEGAEADDDCLVKWGKEHYSAEIVASEVEASAITSSVVSATNPSERLSSAGPISLSNPLTLCDQSEPVGVPSPIRRSFSFSMSPPPLSPPLPPFYPLTPLPQSDVSQVVEAVQKMEAGIVAAINNLKLDAFARPSWSARTPWDDSASPVPRTSAADQEASTLAFQQPQPPPLSRPFASPCTSNGDSPRCLPIRESQNHLPSSEIENSHLRPPELTVQLHRNLTAESKIHTLALKLAVESFFGHQVMARCTVMGCATYKGLPINELNSLKLFI